MTKYTMITAFYNKPTEYAKSIGYKAGDVITRVFYRTDSHALALSQCKKDNPNFTSDRVTLMAETVDIDSDKYKELYRVCKENEYVFDVYEE